MTNEHPIKPQKANKPVRPALLSKSNHRDRKRHGEKPTKKTANSDAKKAGWGAELLHSRKDKELHPEHRQAEKSSLERHIP